MTVPAVPDEEPRRIRLRPLPEYEPDEVGAPPRRWSSLRPVSGPQLTLAPPEPPPGRPPVPTEVLAQVLRRVLEAIDGRRPVAQLHSLLPDAVFEGMLTRLRTTGPGAQHILRSMRTCYPSSEAVEVAAVIDFRPRVGEQRVIAAAARFEHEDDRWMCTVLRLL